MAFKYLQLFLDARLFTIAEENSNYQFLTATIPLFEKAISKNKSKIIAATLVALDQHIPQDEPILDEVEELLKKKWPLVRNKYTDRPSTLLRAIILESLYNLRQENKVTANLIWLTGSNFFPFVSASNETPILQEWLREAGELAESNATSEWELSTNIKAINIPEFTLGKISLPNVKFEKEALKKGLGEAVMNGEQQIQIVNQGYSNAHSKLRQEWATEFSTKAAESFFTVFSNAYTTLTASLNAMNIDKPINEFFTSFKNDLANTLESSLKSGEKLRLRSQILWWKEALYSASNQKSYRDMDAAQVSLAMAIDLAASTQAVYPISIDYILKETVLSCLGTDETDRSIAKVLSELIDASSKMPNSIDLPERGRVSFGAFVVGMVSKKITPDELLARTGISPELKISYRQLATLLFHDIQASQINIK
ncbi:GTPase-associated system all-helical protein GASH [Larkinella sp.]|uniref:GTPase-associated system all-helical protein GASH n=1 Tax=Larkinella sp. TaxID=2034517 RepID=UPI003BA9FAF5